MSVTCAILIRAALSSSGALRLRLTPRRPADVSPLLCGKDAALAPDRVGRLFSLCAKGQRAAARLAVAAALGRPDPKLAIEASRSALAERIGETLRSSTLVWPGSAEPGARRSAVDRLRIALSACAQLAGDDLDAATAQRPLSDLRRTLEALGLGEDEPDPELWFGQVWRELCALELPPAPAPDALTLEDGERVFRALSLAPVFFTHEPQIPGRACETGAFARRYAKVNQRSNALIQRLEARLIDLCSDLARLEDMIRRPAPEPDLAFASAGEPGEGLAMVHTARGRLYHRVSLDPSGQIGAYAILAPTEWNFHRCGPFVHAAQALAVENLKDAKTRLDYLIALFDPCVDHRLELAHA